MRNIIKKTIYPLAALLLLAACSQDEIMDDNALPEGKYPLEIASVSLIADVDEQPWGAENAPQTRVTESADGTKSVWENGDEFYVKFEGSNQVGTYKITNPTTGAVEAVKPVYWQSASKEQTIIAWYAPKAKEDGTIDVSDQSKGLAYVVRAERKATYNSSSNAAVSLSFVHQLAKVRVYLKGTAYNGNNANGVTLSYPSSYTVKEGKVELTTSTANGSIKMHKAENADYYEALVLPGTIATDGNSFTVTLNGTTSANVNLSASLTLTAGSKHDVTLKIHKNGTTEVNLSEQQSVYTINDNSTYYFYNSGNNGIKVASGSPDIYLDDATINVSSGNAIDIAASSSKTTIHVAGTKNSVTSNKGAGIYVAQGSTVTITGNSRNDQLTARGGNRSPGIGACYDNDFRNCGNIYITNVSVMSHGSAYAGMFLSPGIGNAGSSYSICGTITIDNATVHAYGVSDSGLSSPGIGVGTSVNSYPALPVVNISNGSEVHAHRGGGQVDYIGFPFNESAIYLGGGSCTSSTIYCYTGETLDKTVKY